MNFRTIENFRLKDGEKIDKLIIDGASNLFLSADGTYKEATGPGFGDMLTSVYDDNEDGKVNAADIADKVDWTGITNKPTEFNPSTHTHEIDDINLLSWNEVDKTIDINQGNGVIQQVGQEQYWRGKNQTGSSIVNGSVVYANGAVGMSGIMTISPFIANGSIPGIYTLGITTEDIANGADGFITTFGKIRGIDTSAWAEGDVLYASPTTAGALTNIKPSLPNLVIPIAFVITVHSTVGTIAVRVPTPTPLAEEISYDNATSGLTAVNVQSAIDELNTEKVDKTTTITINGIENDLSGNINLNVSGQNFTKSGLIAGEAMSALQVYRRGDKKYYADIITTSPQVCGTSMNFKITPNKNTKLSEITITGYRGLSTNATVTLTLRDTTNTTILESASNTVTYSSTVIDGVFAFAGTYELQAGTTYTFNLACSASFCGYIGTGLTANIAYPGGGTLSAGQTFFKSLKYNQTQNKNKFYIATADIVGNFNYEGIVGNNVVLDGTFNGSFDGIVGGFTGLLTGHNIGDFIYLGNDGNIAFSAGTNSVIIGKIFSDTEIELTQRINGQTSITATTGSVVTGNAQGYITINIPGLGNKKIPYWGV